MCGHTVNHNPVHFNKRVWAYLASPWRIWEPLVKGPWIPFSWSPGSRRDNLTGRAPKGLMYTHKNPPAKRTLTASFCSLNCFWRIPCFQLKKAVISTPSIPDIYLFWKQQRQPIPGPECCFLLPPLSGSGFSYSHWEAAQESHEGRTHFLRKNQRGRGWGSSPWLHLQVLQTQAIRMDPEKEIRCKARYCFALLMLLALWVWEAHSFSV